MNDPSTVGTHETRRKCAGHKGDGSPCGNWPIHGANVCGSHGGRAPQVRKKAAVVAELMRWGLDHEKLAVPGETMLQLITQSKARLTLLSGALGAKYADRGIAALVGVVIDEEGHITGEYLTGLAKLESEERDRCARFCNLAESSGIARDQVQAYERYGAGIVSVLRDALVALGHDPDAPEVREIVSVALRAIA